MVNRLVDELKTIESFQMNGKCKQQPNLKARHWIPPGNEQCKINIDAAVSRGTNKGTVGAICRDDQGCFISTTI